MDRIRALHVDKNVYFVLSFDLILCGYIVHQGLPSDSFSTENGVMVTRGSRY